MNSLGLMAALSPKLPVSTERGPFLSPGARDTVLIILTAVAIGLLGILWAVYLRRQSRRDRRSPTIIDSAKNNSSRSRQKRRKRKESLSRKPTLAETGGLPPIKEGPSNPMQSL